MSSSPALGPIDINLGALLTNPLYGVNPLNQGDNVLAVEVHWVNGGTMTLPTQLSAATVGGLSVQGGANVSGGTLTGGAFDLRSGAISANLAGADAVTKTTGGTVVLGGINSYAGGTTVSEGTLVVNSAAALPAGRGLTIGAGATLVLSSGLGVGTGQAALNSTFPGPSAEAQAPSAASVSVATPLVSEQPTAVVATAPVAAPAVLPLEPRPAVRSSQPVTAARTRVSSGSATGHSTPPSPAIARHVAARDSALRSQGTEGLLFDVRWLKIFQEPGMVQHRTRLFSLRPAALDAAIVDYTR